MSKGIIVLDEIPKSCIDCPVCYHSEDMSLGRFQYERLYRCKLEPEEVEQVYLEDILHKKPEWCPIKPMPEKKSPMEQTVSPMITEQYEPYDRGWNDCIDEIFKEKCNG